MNILVTGGLDVNGAWLTRQLLEEGHRPVVYENRPDTTLVSDIARKLDIITGDIMDLAGVIRLLKQYKIKLITHLAALMPGPAQENPLMGLQVNALGTVNPGGCPYHGGRKSGLYQARGCFRAGGGRLRLSHL